MSCEKEAEKGKPSVSEHTKHAKECSSIQRKHRVNYTRAPRRTGQPLMNQYGYSYRINSAEGFMIKYTLNDCVALIIHTGKHGTSAHSHEEFTSRAYACTRTPCTLTHTHVSVVLCVDCAVAYRLLSPPLRISLLSLLLVCPNSAE